MMRRRIMLTGCLLGLLTGLLTGALLPVKVNAQDTSTDTSTQQGAANAEDTPWFRQTASSNKFALIVVGAAANDEIRQRMRAWAVDLHTTLRDDYGYAGSRIELLLDDGVNTGNASAWVRGSSRVEDVQAAVSRIATAADSGDQLSVFLFGHGSSTFGEAKFNNVGSDMTGQQFAAMLAPLDGVDMVIFNTTSASFEFSRELSAMGRIVVSATRSAAERYDPVFGGQLVAALQGKRADIDRNARVSVLEVFNYASARVGEWYREQQRLPTENAVLDDSGDGMFSREPGAGQADGMLAEIAWLDVASAGEQKTSPEAQRLRSEMQNLERDIFILRNQKSNYLEEDYWNRLEALLIELATRTRRYHEIP